MIKPIMTKQFFPRQPSEEATGADAQIAHDLADTLEANRATCVGMAANMIGERKRIIAVIDDDGFVLVMLNPRLVHWMDVGREKQLVLTFALSGFSGEISSVLI